MNITRETFDELNLNYEVRNDYSGRDMYGAECFAIVTDESAWALCKSLSEILAGCIEYGNPEDVVSGINSILDREPRQDNMGHDFVYYWPNIQVEEG